MGPEPRAARPSRPTARPSRPADRSILPAGPGVAGLVLLLGLAGCGGGEPAADPSDGETAPAAEAMEEAPGTEEAAGMEEAAPDEGAPGLRTPAREELPESFLGSLDEEGRTLVVFHARSWDRASRELLPVVDQIESDHPELTVVRVDVDEAQDVAGAYRVPGVPVAAILRGVEPVAVLADSVTPEALRRFAGQAP